MNGDDECTWLSRTVDQLLISGCPSPDMGRKRIGRLSWNPTCRATEDAGVQYTVSAWEAVHDELHELKTTSPLLSRLGKVIGRA